VQSKTEQGGFKDI